MTFLFNFLNRSVWLFLALVLSVTASHAKMPADRHTHVSIKGNMFLINGIPTYRDVYWQANKIEGLLFNSRMVQGIFDDENIETQGQFIYPDTGKWDADRNTREFIEAMSSWKENGLLAFTLNLQGGSPIGYGNKGWRNSLFTPNGKLKAEYLSRLEKIIDRADELGMVVILGYFYFGQDEYLKDEKAVISAVDAITEWVVAKQYKNLLIEINNEADIYYDHEILTSARVDELIRRVKHISQNQLLVSTSFSGGIHPTDSVLALADYILLHGNSVPTSAGVIDMVRKVKQSSAYRGQPIIFNEDDHFDFDNDHSYFSSAIREYASWGYFDYRMTGESFDDGFQTVPVNWNISSQRKKDFFDFLSEVTAGDVVADHQGEFLKNYIGTWYATDVVDDKALGADPTIKMVVVPVLAGRSIQVLVYRREDKKWVEILAEIISYDEKANRIVAAGQSSSGMTFTGTGYFVDAKTWHMKDYDFFDDFTLNVSFNFTHENTVVLRGIGTTPEKSWATQYIRTNHNY